MAIELTPVSITKDSQSIRGFEFDRAIVAPQSIPQIIQVNFPSLKSNEVGKFRLSDQISFDLLVRSFTIDIKHDDSDSISSAQYHSGNTPLIFFLTKPDTYAFKKSTLLKLVNQGDFLAAAKQFGRWVNANGKKLPGLVSRREEEKKLFLS